MVMPSIDEDDLAIILYTIFVILITYAITSTQSIDHLQKEAVSHGYAEYITEGNKYPTFKWKENERTNNN